MPGSIHEHNSYVYSYSVATYFHVYIHVLKYYIGADVEFIKKGFIIPAVVQMLMFNYPSSSPGADLTRSLGEQLKGVLFRDAAKCKIYKSCSSIQ